MLDLLWLFERLYSVRVRILGDEIPRSCRHIRVASKHELKERITAGIEDVNRHPTYHLVLQARPRLPNMILRIATKTCESVRSCVESRQPSVIKPNRSS